MIPKDKIKDHVWFYLNGLFAGGKEVSDVTNLTVPEIYKNLKKDGISEKEVKTALTQYVKDGSLEQRWISLEIYYPKDKEQLIPSKIVKFFNLPAHAHVFIGSYLFILLSFIPQVKSWFTPLAKLTGVGQLVSYGLLFGVVSVYTSYFILSLVRNHVDGISAFITEMKQNSTPFARITRTFVFLLAVYLPVIWIFELNLNSADIITHIIALLGAAGIYVGLTGKKKD